MRITRKKGIAGAAVIAILAVSLSACNSGTPSGQAAENARQRANQKALENNQPLPHFNWSQWRQDLIDVEAAESNDVPTTSFALHLGSQDPVFTCPSIGFPLPVTTSLSNPEQVIDGHTDTVTTPQQDPNGVYMPPTGEGTWLVCTYANGEPYINYIEDNVDTAGGPAVWNYSKHAFELVGAPTAGTTLGK
jgi:hypothetical protein